MPRAHTKSQPQHASAPYIHHSGPESRHTEAGQLVLENTQAPRGAAARKGGRAHSKPGSDAKKAYVCSTCSRAFTTSGHLARHIRVHTGERNHKCPFPGCETRCSRQDNLHQHYRIHLSPGSRRTSARSAMARAATKDGATESTPGEANAAAGKPSKRQQGGPPTPPLSPHSLDQTRVSQATPPDSPPPLTYTTLPATIHNMQESGPPTSSLTGNAPSNYSSIGASGMSSLPTHMGIEPSVGHTSLQYSYRSSHHSYPEQQQQVANYVSGYGSSVPPSLSQSPAISDDVSSPYSAYPSPHMQYTQPPGGGSFHHSRNMSPDSPQGRHYQSRSSYSQSCSPALGTPSPESSPSANSRGSGTSTPLYPLYSTDHIDNPYSSSMSQLSLPPSRLSQTGSHLHPSRFSSPSPTLAPIQSTQRYHRRDDRAMPSSLHTVSYIHQPQPQSRHSDFQYHQSMSPAHSIWTGHEPLRKGAVAPLQ